MTTYTNPVLDADWSDPDVVRVGDDFYLTASSFGRVPGLPLLHSRDLVDWTLVGHALERLEPEEEFTRPRHDRGVWAPSIRHHDDRFWIFWGDPDHGVFQVNAPDIRGPWTRPHLVKAGRGLIDPCPLWDEETGEAYLVHAWARSRAGVKNRLTGHRMHPEGTALLDEGKVIVDADRIPGWFTLEGPKLYRHDGWFWILAPAGGVETGWQGAFRSRGFFGPYEERIVLEQKDTEVNGPHQGGWVRTPSGEDWFLHFQQRGAYGRVVHLQPMRWDGPDGWPVIGDDGAPVLVHPRPALPAQPPAAPATDDDFPGGRYGRQWQWTANPRAGWATQHSGDGLRLACLRTPDAHDLRKLPHVLTQRLPGAPSVVEVDLELHAQEPGARAGLAVLGDAYCWIGLRRGTDGTVHLVHRFAEQVAEAERDAGHSRPAPGGRVRLRIETAPGARCRFSHDLGGGFEPSGPVFAATPWRWVGALLGLFALAPAGPAHDGEGHAGAAAFTRFRIRPL
ncbi:family 43 glycosylhydrolase [Streptomyces longwoodensis]|uniref:glycoside hydrolase family 43 protein n=1 Tax=Streptomyces longwoodensis TaxID=68231 RepID=UPI00225B222A|nr:glycoside hydrolase 43 family protein [Streptomyces longwoodensis]MCX4999002.1 glycoside hydrolase 43 family protein [Streptomyces longwoodensis]WTI47770.1 glycoside hydrolase 43 family protein [Streptomyces longwoodensis]WUC60508.1 glycoside hydrolase 43 family protein [Streptomyces longwoodensis]